MNVLSRELYAGCTDFITLGSIAKCWDMAAQRRRVVLPLYDDFCCVYVENHMVSLIAGIKERVMDTFEC